jgi:hypothetical protein
MDAASSATLTSASQFQNLARVLLEVVLRKNANALTFIGCSEIENRGVLEIDLIKEPKL